MKKLTNASISGRIGKVKKSICESSKISDTTNFNNLIRPKQKKVQKHKSSNITSSQERPLKSPQKSPRCLKSKLSNLFSKSKLKLKLKAEEKSNSSIKSLSSKSSTAKNVKKSLSPFCISSEEKSRLFPKSLGKNISLAIPASSNRSPLQFTERLRINSRKYSENVITHTSCLEDISNNSNTSMIHSQSHSRNEDYNWVFINPTQNNIEVSDFVKNFQKKLFLCPAYNIQPLKLAFENKINTYRQSTGNSEQYLHKAPDKISKFRELSINPRSRFQGILLGYNDSLESPSSPHNYGFLQKPLSSCNED
ncbi:hypothetical protein SteCoe_38239 [Stentor coeruleus]|uniref:Uncharacterized protein n=1 Tax=Stentor coeruleus TaxID=5963 RepID=A0A1R2ALZ6_9CILI|nr:hypothetical protein SteCoe_38239 [Stentor coeruleus]